MARFIQREVAGGVILAGKRTGQTAAWAGIDSLQVWFESMLIPLRLGFCACFVTAETSPNGHSLSAEVKTSTNPLHTPVFQAMNFNY
jgi:hypothetical protein